MVFFSWHLLKGTLIKKSVISGGFTIKTWRVASKITKYKMSLSFFHSSRLINMSWHADYLSSSTSSTGMNMFSKWIYKFNLPSEHFTALFTRCTFEAVICTIFENRFNQFFCLSDSKIPLYSRKYLDNRGPFSFHIRSVKKFWHLMATHHTNM